MTREGNREGKASRLHFFRFLSADLFIYHASPFHMTEEDMLNAVISIV